MIALTIGYFALPSISTALWLLVGLSAAAAVVAGIHRHRPRRAWPWLLQAGSVVALVSGDTIFNILTKVLGQTDPFPSAVDVIYLVFASPLQVIGLYGLARAAMDRSSMLDAVTLTSGLGLLSWIFLIDPYVQDPHLTALEKSISIAYPLYDVLVLAMIVQLLVTADRTVTLRLLALGGTGLLVADVLYSLIQLRGVWIPGNPVDLAWAVFYTAWGAAALHPSMIGLTEPRIRPVREVGPRLLMLLTCSSLIPPGALLVESLTGRVRHGTGIAIMSAVMFVLVLARLSGVVGMHRRALRRERSLREAGAALLSATDDTEVITAVRTAVARLLPEGTPHTVVYWRPSGSPASPAAESPVVAGEAGTGPVVLRRTAALPPELVAELGDTEYTLVCSLSSGGEPAHGGPGVFAIAAGEAALVGLEGIIEVLTAQTALALQRVALGSEINRRRSEEYFRTLVHHTADVILILDAEERIRYASPSADTVFGMAAFAGQALLSLIHPEDRRQATQFLAQLAGGSPVASGASWRMLRADRTVIEVEASFQDLRDDRTVQGVVATVRDVTERRRMESELTHQAYYDTVTGLPNRALFTDRLAEAVLRAEANNTLVGVLFIDLDDFKMINDTLGHTVGDDVLITVGERLMGTVRAHDTVARFGGDEFAALIEDANEVEEVDAVAARVLAALSQPIPLGEHLVGGGASIGIATTVEALDGPDLMRQADLALHVAKTEGKGQFRRYQTDLHTRLLTRMEIKSDLEEAVATGAFVLHYQPIVALEDGATVGFEALVRWQHPQRGLVGPGEFIDVAEESGLILGIGEWVIDQAITAALAWHREATDGPAPYISVNVSARQFRAAGFVERLRTKLERSGLPPEQLLLEITESLLLRDDEQVWTDLMVLRDLGVRVAIDDFGTGYSALSYLQQVPIDVLKIDRSFVDAVATSRRQEAVVDTIVRLARVFELRVVAEGIERPEDRAALVTMGCEFGQGYLFAKPLSYGDAVQWLRAEKVAA